MIVRHADSARLLITQPDHAALAARLMERWDDDGLPGLPYRATLLRAIAEHDNGWREPDRAPIVDDRGDVLDFVTAPAEIRRGVWPRGVDRLADDPYAAALVAQHALHVLGRYRGDADWAPFFDEMTRRRAQYLARARREERALAADYVHLRTADLMSLVICNAWTEEQRCGRHAFALGRRPGEPAGPPPDEAALLRLVISPDPFDRGAVAFEIRARRLPASSFASAEEARAVFEAAPSIVLRGVATGA